MSKKIGFAGMGIMGLPMSKHILKEGYEVTVYNRTKEKTAPATENGAKIADSPRELCRESDTIILMLTGPEAIDAVLAGPGGILEEDCSGKILINMSTVSPAYARKLADILARRGIEFVDAPVSGSKKPAEDGTLVILAGGDRETVRRQEALLLTMGKKVVYCGEAGQGSAMKMVVNLLLGVMMEGLCEAVTLGEKCGLSKESIIETLLAGPLGCGLFNLKSEMLMEGDYPTQFPFKHMTKDIRFVLQTADEKGAPTPVGHAVFQLYRHGMGQGMGDMDFAAVKKVLDAMCDCGDSCSTV